MKFVATGVIFATTAVTCAGTVVACIRTSASGARIWGEATRPPRGRKRATSVRIVGTCVATGATGAPIGVTSVRTVVTYGRTNGIRLRAIRRTRIRNTARDSGTRAAKSSRGAACCAPAVFLPPSHLRRDPLRVAQHAQDIQSSHLLHVRLSPTTSQQYRAQIQQLRED